jgi:hypothetical protein
MFGRTTQLSGSDGFINRATYFKFKMHEPKTCAARYSILRGGGQYVVCEPRVDKTTGKVYALPLLATAGNSTARLIPYADGSKHSSFIGFFSTTVGMTICQVDTDTSLYTFKIFSAAPRVAKKLDDQKREAYAESAVTDSALTAMCSDVHNHIVNIGAKCTRSEAALLCDPKPKELIAFAASIGYPWMGTHLTIRSPGWNVTRQKAWQLATDNKDATAEYLRSYGGIEKNSLWTNSLLCMYFLLYPPILEKIEILDYLAIGTTILTSIVPFPKEKDLPMEANLLPEPSYPGVVPTPVDVDAAEAVAVLQDLRVGVKKRKGSAIV